MKDLKNLVKVADNIYHFVIDHGCEFCNKRLRDCVHNHQLSSESRVIIETKTQRCDIRCDTDFLTSINHFKSIAYIIGKQSQSHDPWIHATVVHNATENTHYFSDYKDAFNWTVAQVVENGE